ncbi:MAG: hypothetical protein K2I75_00135 [Clostridiales bacterium]|nr:hypothetical protein [Clostridiales bacterium]
MNAAEIILLVVTCVAFAAALGVIIYNVVKGKSCCGDCDGCSGCHKTKKGESACDGRCAHCLAHMQNANASDDKDGN